MRIPKITFLILLLLVWFILIGAIIPLRFSWEPTPSEYSVFKGGSVDIDYTITNQEDFQITCSITSASGTIPLRTINPKGTLVGSFRYTAPNKIKNLQNPYNYDVTVYCSGTYSYRCGFLLLDTCYENRDFTFPKMVKINFRLSDQDQRNLNILEEYRRNIADKVTDVDKKNQKINELITKTPNPILPKNTKEDNSENQKRINSISNRFSNIVKALEEEDYGIGSIISLSSDLNELSNADNKIKDLTNAINANQERYNKIVTNLNTILTEVSGKSAKLTYKFNSELLNKLDEIGKVTHSKLTNYQFTDLDDADIVLQTYSKEKDELLSKMEKNLNDYSNSGLSIILKQIDVICSKFNLCSTKNKVKSLNLETTKNFYDLCNSYDELSNEIKLFNDNETKRYKTKLADLNKKNQEIKNKNEVIQSDIDRIKKINDLKENLNVKLITIEKDLVFYVKKANSYGKTVNLSSYSKVVIAFNNLTLNEKYNKTSELGDVANQIKNKVGELTSQEKGFISFFKKIYYTMFGVKQELDKLKLEQKEEPPNLIPEIPNTINAAQNVVLETETIDFIINICKISDKKLTDLKAKPLDIKISEKASTIKTDVKEAEKTCFDENNQRTTQCCDGDEYKNRADLYPVVFVHGHSFELSRGDIQSSLNTFNFMSKYFSNNGYVEKSLLYPESTDQLVKGSWAYCNKPVVVRLTYYDGLVSGTTHNYKNSIAEYSPVIKREIDSIQTATNKDKAIIVAHSMGGILSRYYIKFDGGSNKIHKLITIGSPHYGIRAWSTFWSPFGAKESQQMTPNSEFLNMLNNPVDSLVPTYTISGNNKGCTLQDCDGVVYVENSKLKSAKDSFVFVGNQYEHSSLVEQSDVAQKVLGWVRS